MNLQKKTTVTHEDARLMTALELDEAGANPNLTKSSRQHVEQQQRENRENENRETYVTEALFMNDAALKSQIEALESQETLEPYEKLRLEVLKAEQSKRANGNCLIM